MPDAAHALVAIALLVAIAIYAASSMSTVKCFDVQAIKLGQVVNLGGC